MSKMTVLQKIIQMFELVGGNAYAELIKEYLKDEEQQIRDTWKSAQLRHMAEYETHGDPEKAKGYPDLETYIKTLTTKP